MQETLIQIPEIAVSFKTGIDWSNAPKINSSKKAVDYFRQIWNVDTYEYREEMKVIFLNRDLRVIGYYNLSIGGICGAICDIKLIVAIAIKCMACNVIVAHNHPSGSLTRSDNDNKTTMEIKQALGYFKIDLQDHLILTADAHYSYADDGMI